MPYVSGKATLSDPARQMFGEPVWRTRGLTAASSFTVGGRKEKYIMKYKPTYGDKQRDEQRRRREEQLRNRQVDSAEKQQPDDSQPRENPRDKKQNRVA